MAPFEIAHQRPFDEVATWHLPQIYLHMLCCGDQCRSALFMSMSALKGAHVFRVHRDDELMQRMLDFVERFANDYGRDEPPPEDFFWGQTGYSELLEAIKVSAKRDVECCARIPDEHVQRGNNAPFFWS